MKRFLTFIMAVSAIVAFSSCEKDNGNGTTSADAPVIEWPGNEDFAVMDITADMSAKLVVKAPAGIKTFVVNVDSDVLEGILQTNELDLINDAAVITMLELASKGALPTGDDLAGKTEVNFDLGALLQMITQLPDVTDGSLHIFTVKLTDNNDVAVTSKPCTFKAVKPETAEE